jgi:hypothetical protein
MLPAGTSSRATQMGDLQTQLDDERLAREKACQRSRLF